MIFFLKKIKTLFEILFLKKFLNRPDFSEKKIFIQAKIIENSNSKKKKINDFSDVEFSAFSQFGEDGIISWLTGQIPNIKRTFLEIGTEDYWESNTRYLLKSQSWKGFIIEGSKDHVNEIKKQKIYWQNELTALNEFVNLENINQIINDKIRQTELGLLSIDIDGNDYWILQEINLECDLIVAEYNPIFGDIHKITIPYHKNFSRSKEHFSNLYFGCSINALIDLMKKKNYLFIGTNTQGMNAFFINKKKYDFVKEKISNIIIFPPKTREGRNFDGNLNFNNLKKNLNMIKDLEVYDIDKKINLKLSEYKDLYSEKWNNYFT